MDLRKRISTKGRARGAATPAKGHFAALARCRSFVPCCPCCGLRIVPRENGGNARSPRQSIDFARTGHGAESGRLDSDFSRRTIPRLRRHYKRRR